MNFRKLGTVALLLVLLVGCPATIKVNITNESDVLIKVIYSTGFESEINSGETKEETYKLDCIRIEADGVLYEFKAILPPDNYFEISSFDSSIYAVFTKKKEFVIHTKNKSESLKLESDC